MTAPATIDAFLRRWHNTSAAERATYQQFFTELCDVLDVPRPDPAHRDAYGFEKLVPIPHGDGLVTPRYIDFYRQGSFAWEAKQGSEADAPSVGTARRGTPGWDRAMRRAWAQVLNYAHYLPDGRPPFILTTDIGHVIEAWTGFDGHYGDYGARTTYRFTDLAEPDVRDRFRSIFLDPLSLDPRRRAARVTTEVAADLAMLARALEPRFSPERVSAFLVRCIFTMFAEDVGLLPAGLFRDALRRHWIPAPPTFVDGLGDLWSAMDTGTKFGFAGKLLQFNGGLFREREVLPLDAGQLELLALAAERDWRDVEPAIFGTLVERALDPVERERLGAHFTPRAYIERLVRRAVIDPVRADWIEAQALARQALGRSGGESPSPSETPAQRKAAVDALRAFHARLCKLRILDPACGTGNFLYVTFDLLKQVEAEVFRELQDLGESRALELSGVSVNPSQLLGIEKNARAREIADLVTWIGYLEWWRHAHGDQPPPEPILRAYRNIECRDAVLDWDDRRPRVGDDGAPVTAWDMRTYTPHPVTGALVPDEAARVPVYDYVGARQAAWPEADFVVSNPPFVGTKRMRVVLGDGYVDALRAVYGDSVGDGSDFVMYWWYRAAAAARAGGLRRFGLITTNSITQVFNRAVVADALDGGAQLLWAVPDHPWVQDGAAVRIAMTVGAGAGLDPAGFGTVVGTGDSVEVAERPVARIHADLSAGPDVASATALAANDRLAGMGVALHGRGFVLADADLDAVPSAERARFVRPLLGGADIVQRSRGRRVIDFTGVGMDEARSQAPHLFQRVLELVKPHRDANRREPIRRMWWRFGWERPELRAALRDLPRFIVTPETAKHRVFTWADAETLPEHGVIAMASQEAWVLGVLGARPHMRWALSAGGTLEDRPRYNYSACFNPFPFPAPPADLRAKIGDLAERLDAHRKSVQAAHPDAFLTAQYNALERLRDATRGGKPLTAKERDFHARALTGVLASLHDDLDRAVAEAYGWPPDLDDDAILERLVALNKERAAEEARGHVRWLRPEFQAPRAGEAVQARLGLAEAGTEDATAKPWPTELGAQLAALRAALATERAAQTATEVARRFKGARKDIVRRHLETLEDLGVVVGFPDPPDPPPREGRRWLLRRG